MNEGIIFQKIMKIYFATHLTTKDNKNRALEILRNPIYFATILGR
jgi:hypothetical protein